MTDLKPCLVLEAAQSHLRTLEAEFDMTDDGALYHDFLDLTAALAAWNTRTEHIVWNTDMEVAPKGVPVLVVGGLAMKKTGGEWFSGMEEPLYQRPLQWEPTKWMHLPPE